MHMLQITITAALKYVQCNQIVFINLNARNCSLDSKKVHNVGYFCLSAFLSRY